MKKQHQIYLQHNSSTQFQHYVLQKVCFVSQVVSNTLLVEQQ